jgi:hypothetical protein
MPAKGQDAMQKSIYLARLIGPVFVAVGIGMLLNTKLYLVMAEQGLHSYVLIYLSGILTLVAGLALVLAHNVWVADWRLILTLLGWLGVIGGTFRILWPQEVVVVGTAIVAHADALTAGGFAVLVLGGVLSYYGYADTKPRARKRRR